MAQPNLESFDRRGVAIKEEVTQGTDSNPAAATDAILMLDGTSGTEVDTVERNIDRPHFTGTPFAVSNKRAFIEGSVELFPPTTPGDATDGTPHGDVLLRMAGMTKVLDAIATPNTTTYNMISSGIISASSYFWHVDALKKILGSRANISGMSFVVGEVPQVTARILGAYENITKEALPTLTLPTFVPEAVTADNTETLISVPNLGTPITDLLVWAKELSVDFGSEIASKEYTSHKEIAISDRSPSFTLRIARTDLVDFNPWSVRDAGEIVEGSITQTIADGRTSALKFRGQIQQINEADIDGDLGWELTGPCIASDTGGDEIQLVFAAA